MKRIIILTKRFEKEIDKLFNKNKLLKNDFEIFKEVLAENPKEGDLIPGTSGIRKIRLKSAHGGKSGGFRVCYYYFTKDEKIILIFIYHKNEQDNITAEQKKMLKEIANEIKKN